jgi:hypothetical protein
MFTSFVNKDENGVDYAITEDYVTLSYTINDTYNVNLSIYDYQTRYAIFETDEGIKNAGTYNILLFKDKVKKGTYYYVLVLKNDNNKKSIIKKMDIL